MFPSRTMEAFVSQNGVGFVGFCALEVGTGKIWCSLMSIPPLKYEVFSKNAKGEFLLNHICMETKDKEQRKI